MVQSLLDPCICDTTLLQRDLQIIKCIPLLVSTLHFLVLEKEEMEGSFFYGHQDAPFLQYASLALFVCSGVRLYKVLIWKKGFFLCGIVCLQWRDSLVRK